MPEASAYARSAALYDAIYARKDYAGEAERVHAWIQRSKRAPGDELLDVACGTGRHLAHLRQRYTVAGLDLDPGLLAVARERNPGVPFHEGDMETFDLGRQFDAVTCLFGAVAYTRTLPRLKQALRTMSRHLRPGGVLIVEPFLTLEAYLPGSVHANFVDQPELKIARMTVSGLEDRVSVLDFHYLVATPAGVDYFAERHKIGLFTQEEYLDACLDADLEVAYDAEGLMGRGLYIGVRPPDEPADPA